MFTLFFTVVAPTPKTSDLRILPGPDYIFLDWPLSTEGWTPNYSIDIEQTNSTFDEDEFLVDNSTSTNNVDKKIVGTFRSSIRPPFNVSALIPENQVLSS